MTNKEFFENSRKIYDSLTKIPTVSGFESLFASDIEAVVRENTGFFTDSEILPSGGVLFLRRAQDKNAPTLLIDAHIDTVGFVVTELRPGGFVGVEPCGGIDRRILFSHEIDIYGKKTVRGVFCSNPPHLKKLEGECNTLPEIKDMSVDTGFPTKKLSQMISVGDMCGFCTESFMMQNDVLCGMSMDNKICAASAVMAAKLLEDQKDFPECNVYLSLSAREETGGHDMQKLARLMPDAAIVMDVNFGRTHEIHPMESYVLGSGCGVSYSSTTSAELTKFLVATAEDCGIPCQTMVETQNTGTNAHKLQISFCGVPCAVLSIPEKFMHSYHEQVSLHDVMYASRLLAQFCKAFPEYHRALSSKRLVKGRIHTGENNGL